MKIFNRMSIALLLSIVIVSCSKDTEVTPIDTDANSELFVTKAADRAPENAFDRFKSVQAEIESKGVPALPLSKEDYSTYFDVAGRPGSMSVKGANMVMDELTTVKELGFDEYIMGKTRYSEFTKTHILKIAGEGYLPGLEEIPGFGFIPANEQELLQEVNVISKDFSEGVGRSALTARSVDCSANGNPAPCVVVMAVAGAVIGNALCGLPCAIGGGIIGGIIGWFSDGGSK